jgi:hypothetical protein
VKISLSGIRAQQVLEPHCDTLSDAATPNSGSDDYDLLPIGFLFGKNNLELRLLLIFLEDVIPGCTANCRETSCFGSGSLLGALTVALETGSLWSPSLESMPRTHRLPGIVDLSGPSSSLCILVSHHVLICQSHLIQPCLLHDLLFWIQHSLCLVFVWSEAEKAFSEL